MTDKAKYERDPRVDPRSGDKLRKGKRERVVLMVYPVAPRRIDGPWVVYQGPTDRKNQVIKFVRPDLWQSWAESAEVIFGARRWQRKGGAR